MTTDLVIMPGTEIPRRPAAAAVDAEQVIRTVALFLNEFENTDTAAAYARDLGVPHVVHAYGLQRVVDQLHPDPNSQLRRMMRGRAPSARAVAPDLLFLPAVLGANRDPMDVDYRFIKVWVSELNARRKADDPKKHLLSQAARSRRVSIAASFYQWAVHEELTDINPVKMLDRKRAGLNVDAHHSNTRGLSTKQLDLLVYAADHYPSPIQKRTAAIIALMATIGCRVSEIQLLDIDDYGWDDGHRTVDLSRKGGKKQRVPVPPVAAKRIDAYLAERRPSTDIVPAAAAGAGTPDSGPLFVTSDYRNKSGGGRLDRFEIGDMLQRVARTHPELEPIADTLHPHVLRHSVTTKLLEAGVPLQDVQDLMGHVNAATTRRYDRARNTLHRSPAYKAGQMLEHGLAALEREHEEDQHG